VDFREVVRGTLPRGAGPRRFALPAGTRGSYVRLRLISAHDATRPRWTLGEFALLDDEGHQRRRAPTLRTAPQRRRTWCAAPRPMATVRCGTCNNLHDGETVGPRGVYSTAGAPPFQFSSKDESVTSPRRSTEGRLRWKAPAGQWTILRYVVMNTGERLKVPSPNSDGWATDHFNPEATERTWIMSRPG
jgi:hypothetical protein